MRFKSWIQLSNWNFMNFSCFEKCIDFVNIIDFEINHGEQYEHKNSTKFRKLNLNLFNKLDSKIIDIPIKIRTFWFANMFEQNVRPTEKKIIGLQQDEYWMKFGYITTLHKTHFKHSKSQILMFLPMHQSNTFTNNLNTTDNRIRDYSSLNLASLKIDVGYGSTNTLVYVQKLRWHNANVTTTGKQNVYMIKTGWTNKVWRRTFEMATWEPLISDAIVMPISFDVKNIFAKNGHYFN